VLARADDRPRVHARRILALVDECLAEAGLGVTGLDALAFGRGPGSFTGVRIAVGVVQGLALGADLPVVPVSTLAALAVAARRRHGAGHVATCVDARMDECYWALYATAEDGLAEAVEPDRLARPETLALPPDVAWFGAGSGWSSWPGLSRRLAPSDGVDAGLLPDAEDLLALAAADLAAGRAVGAAGALPVYLRDEVAWQGSPPVTAR
jgi:tRNA threonylcarbamoyladenosine biosynthesis protein TsaB